MPELSRRHLVRLLPALGLALVACTSEAPAPATPSSDAQPAPAAKDAGVVNVYSHRHYETDKKLFAQFEQETGISVRVVKAGADALIERLASEGASSPADLLITADAGRLVRPTPRPPAGAVRRAYRGGTRTCGTPTVTGLVSPSGPA